VSRTLKLEFRNIHMCQLKIPCLGELLLSEIIASGMCNPTRKGRPIFNKEIL